MTAQRTETWLKIASGIVIVRACQHPGAKILQREFLEQRAIGRRDIDVTGPNAIQEAGQFRKRLPQTIQVLEITKEFFVDFRGQFRLFTQRAKHV